jgi:hypothetical protein
MICRRCQGLLVPTWLLDPREVFGTPGPRRAWRCVNCGDLWDWLMLRRRAWQAAPAGARAEGDPVSVLTPRAMPPAAKPATA